MAYSRQFRPSILLVDDDPDMLGPVREYLEGHGFTVWLAADSCRALRLMRRQRPHLALVDLRLPGMDGVELSRRIKRHCDIPIIVVSGTDEEAEMVSALDEFAEDFLVKPLRPRELTARIWRSLRRAWPVLAAAESTVRIGNGRVVDFARLEVRSARGRVGLTPTEARLLQLLVSNPYRLIPSSRILDRIWPDSLPHAGYLWEYIRRVRAKIGDDARDPRFIVSERGVGYVCRPDGRTLNLAGRAATPASPPDARWSASAPA